jgi:hypothetical protein
MQAEHGLVPGQCRLPLARVRLQPLCGPHPECDRSASRVDPAAAALVDQLVGRKASASLRVRNVRLYCRPSGVRSRTS